jgi:hypothetical protein
MLWALWVFGVGWYIGLLMGTWAERHQTVRPRVSPVARPYNPDDEIPF